MIEAFNGQEVPLGGLWPGIAALAALAGCLAWKFSGRSLRWYVPAGVALVGMLAGGVPVWDQLRLRAMLASGEGLSVTRGRIAQVWHIVERRRDWTHSGTGQRHKTVTSEGFDVGADRFSWVTGSCLSAASMCRLTHSKVTLREGLEVEVTWFADPAQGDDKRVLRLMVMEPGLPGQPPRHMTGANR